MVFDLAYWWASGRPTDGFTKMTGANDLSLNGLTHTKPYPLIEHTHIYIYIYIRICIYIYMCVYIYIYMYMYACQMYSNLCVEMYTQHTIYFLLRILYSFIRWFVHSLMFSERFLCIEPGERNDLASKDFLETDSVLTSLDVPLARSWGVSRWKLRNSWKKKDHLG